MAAPPSLPPISQIDPTSNFFFSFNDPNPHRNPFMADADQSVGQNAGQNHDREVDPAAVPPPPPPPADLPMPQPPPPAPQDVNMPAEANNQQNRPDDERQSASDDVSSSDHEESDAEDGPPQEPWIPIQEDTSLPCEDELTYISSKSEHSALDHLYWEKKTFFDLDDPQYTPVGSGRIDFVVERFNGTQENPNKDLIMRSEVVSIGGYDWRLKFYPKGNDCEHLSVYIECVTMQEPDFEESGDFASPPLPFLAGQDQPKKRHAVSVQYCCVMYNPDEPRTYEHQVDAHQFTKSLADYGWTRFTRYSRRDFYLRNHGQRQSILRNDKLAFKLFLRVVKDPTGCLWSHSSKPYDDSIASTGLRPFATLTPMFAAKLPLLHFAPFREFIYNCKDTKIVSWFQTVLWKMMSRTCSSSYGVSMRCPQSDAVAWARFCFKSLKKETDASRLIELVGSFDPDQGAAVCGNRLKTKSIGSIQAAVNAHPTPLETPAFLTLELERQEFDRKERKWNKLTNKVTMEDRIVVSGTSYVLFGFVTHFADLTSNKFNVYLRPDGSATNLWYAYSDGNVSCLTQKQAVDRHCGFDEGSSAIKEKRHSIPRSVRAFHRIDDMNEVAHVVYYVKEEHAFSATRPPPIEEVWEAPEHLRKQADPKEAPELPPTPPTAAVAAAVEAGDNVDNVLQAAMQRQIEQARKDSIAENGNATPNAWIKDGDDVVMSDADDDSVQTQEEPSEPKPLTDEVPVQVTIEHLGREYFKGQMVGHKYHGQGHQISMNGDEYEGGFVDHQKSGRGKMIYARTGNIYEGEWLNDQHHGQGKLTELATGNVFHGGWKNGKKHGRFILKGTVTDEDKGCCSICYEKEINTAFYDCGHVLACKECSQKIDNCPICRKRVLARLELFGVKMSFE